MNKYEKIDLVLRSLVFCISLIGLFTIYIGIDQVTSYIIWGIGTTIMIFIIYFFDKKYKVTTYFKDREHSLTFWGHFWGLIALYILIFIVACVLLNWYKYY